MGGTGDATYGCMGARAALQHRGKTGEGQIVDSALYEAVLEVMESTVSDYSASGAKRQRTGSTLPGIAPSNAYPCKDGEYLIGAHQDRVFARLAAATRRPELASDENYAATRGRGAGQAEIDALIRIWTAKQRDRKSTQLNTKHTCATT